MRKNEKLFRIAAGSIENNVVCDIKEFYGNKKEVIDFMNKEYARRLLTNFREDNVVFNLVYQNKDELLLLDNWASLEDLETLNIVVCEVK